MGPGTPDQFGPCILIAHGLLVGPGRGHNLETVGYGDDARTERHLITPQAERIAITVETLVVFIHTVGPIPQPLPERFDPPATFLWMVSERSPFVVRGFAVLVENRCRNGQLADVVEQRSPPKQCPIGFGELELLGDHIGERPNLFRMSPGLAVVLVQEIDQLKRLQRRSLGIGGQTLASELFENFLGSAGVSHSQGQLDAVRGLIGKLEVQLTQR